MVCATCHGLSRSVYITDVQGAEYAGLELITKVPLSHFTCNYMGIHEEPSGDKTTQYVAGCESAWVS